MYDFDSNYIDAEPIKLRKTPELVRAFEETYNRLKRSGYTARLLRLDNKISKKLIEAIESEEELTYQLVSPGDHRQNPAERAI